MKSVHVLLLCCRLGGIFGSDRVVCRASCAHM